MRDSIELFLNGKKIKTAAEILRAVANPVRFQILSFIHEQQKANVDKICRTLQLEQSHTSQHLKVLREANLVLTHRKGKHIFYSLNYEVMQLLAELTQRFFSA